MNLNALAVDRQHALLSGIDATYTQAHVRLDRSSDLELLLSDFAYLAAYPRLTTLHFYYDGIENANSTQLIPLVLGNHLHHSAVVEFGIHSDEHVVRSIHFFAGAKLQRLTLACVVRIDDAIAFPNLSVLKLARAFHAPNIDVPFLMHLTLDQFEAAAEGGGMPPASQRTLTLHVERYVGKGQRLVRDVLHPYRNALGYLYIEDASGGGDDLVIDTSFSALRSLVVRRCNFRAVRFAVSSKEAVAFERLEEIVLEASAGGPLRPGVLPKTVEMAQQIPQLLKHVSRLEMTRHTHFWMGALGLPQLTLYRGPLAIPPGAVLESRAMDLDQFLLSESITPWQTLLMHRLREHNRDGVTLLSSVDHPFDIPRRVAPYFRKAVIADPNAFFAPGATICAICRLEFNRSEHERESAAEIESNAFLDNPYDLINHTATGCVVVCNASTLVHGTHFTHRTCFSLSLFNNSPNYVCPYQVRLV